MKALNQDTKELCLTQVEHELFRTALERIFREYDAVQTSKNKSYVPVPVLNNNYLQQTSIYILEQVYEKIIKLKFSVFDAQSNATLFKITQTEIEILYVIHEQFQGCEQFVNQLKLKAKWLYYDKELEKQLEPEKEAKLEGAK